MQINQAYGSNVDALNTYRADQTTQNQTQDNQQTTTTQAPAQTQAFQVDLSREAQELNNGTQTQQEEQTETPPPQQQTQNLAATYNAAGQIGG